MALTDLKVRNAKPKSLTSYLMQKGLISISAYQVEKLADLNINPMAKSA